MYRWFSNSIWHGRHNERGFRSDFYNDFRTVCPGWYQYPTPHGGFVYIYIGNNVLMS